MKKIILIAVGAVVLLGGGTGGTMVFLGMGKHGGKPAAAPPPKPKPILFAQLDSIVASVPADTGDSAQAYVQFTVQFSTFDPNALVSFTTLMPIIKSQILNLLMTKTAKNLMDPSTHDALASSCLNIVNKVLDKSAGYTPPDPFTAAYITNIVEQD